MKIAYINSLSRSGSTFLQMLLSRQPDSVGLGELARAVRNLCRGAGGDPVDVAAQQAGVAVPPRLGEPCFCGQAPRECEFWGPLIPQLSQLDAAEAHRRVLERFAQQYPGRMIVDGSKTTASLTRFYLASPEPEWDIRVLFLVRDFRGWVLSAAKHASITRALSRRPRIAYGYLQDCYRWWYSNARALRTLRSSGVPHLVVSYENLVFRTCETLESIGHFLGSRFAGSSGSGAPAAMHELYGSPGLKFSEEKRSGIRYDHSWLSDWRPLAAGPLLLPIFRFNRRVCRQSSDLAPGEQYA